MSTRTSWLSTQSRSRPPISFEQPSPSPHPPPRRPDLPLYKRADVARHNKPGDVWVTRADGVYDVSEFVAGHPGGPARLMLAAGKPERSHTFKGVYVLNRVASPLPWYAAVLISDRRWLWSRPMPSR